MLIDFDILSGHGHHSLATKKSDGGFAIARLKINNDGMLIDLK